MLGISYVTNYGYIRRSIALEVSGAMKFEGYSFIVYGVIFADGFEISK